MSLGARNLQICKQILQLPGRLRPNRLKTIAGLPMPQTNGRADLIGIEILHVRFSFKRRSTRLDDVPRQPQSGEFSPPVAIHKLNFHPCWIEGWRLDLPYVQQSRGVP
jgi:hypothetical protein